MPATGYSGGSMGASSLYTEEASGLEPVTGHNQWGRQIQLTYNRALFLITSPLHRQKGLFMDEK
jgi:hypothetical protein